MGIEGFEDLEGLAALAALAEEITASAERSYILWRVHVTWAHKGRKGEGTYIVAALDAIRALQLVWEPEEARDLRTVEIEWLSPVDCVVGREALV